MKGFVFVLLKSVSLFFLLFFLSLTVSSKSLAQTSPQYKLNTNPDVPQNLNTYTQSVFVEILSTASCFLTGANPANPSARCLGVDGETGKLGYTNEKPGGLLMVMGSMIGKTYDIPISTYGYVNYLAGNFGFSKKAYAQGLGTGIGFIGLQPVLFIWSLFRNLTYLVFVFVFILLGLGIMFRVNIDARTVMTIQNQIPKIVVGLILITFSYAIAGFLIDMMYVAIYLIIHLFADLYKNVIGGQTPFSDINTNPVAAAGAFGVLFGIAWTPATIVGGAVRTIIGGAIDSVLQGTIGTIIGMIIVAASGPLGWAGYLFGGGTPSSATLAPQLAGLIAGTIAYLIIVVAIFSALFRTWFMLIKAYIYILLGVIFAPFWIMVGILPIGTGGVGPWLRSLIANLASFPVVITLFLIGKTIIDIISASKYDPKGNFMPPLIGNIGSDNASVISAFIGLGFILILPEALNITKSTLKAPDFKLSSAAGRALAVGGKIVSTPPRLIWDRLTHHDPMGIYQGGALAEWATHPDREGGIGPRIARTIMRIGNRRPVGPGGGGH